MKRNTKCIYKCYVFILFVIFINNAAVAQLHAPPACGENFTLDWSSSPTASNEFNWTPAGALTNTFNNVDNSGIDFTVTFTGDTGTLGVWGSQTPKVGTSATGSSVESIDLYTTGFSATGITCTITFSSPIYALSFDLSHVNASPPNGDMYTITAQTTDGSTIYPTFTSSANPSYTVNNATGVVDANKSSTSGTDAIVGVNFLDPDYITSVSFLWQNCSVCSNAIHGSGLGNFSFCIPQTLDFDGVNDYIDRAAFLGGKSEATMMSWIKLDNGFDGGEIMGQRNFRLYVDSNKYLKAFLRTDTNRDVNTVASSNTLLSENRWYHTAVKYDGVNGTVDLYLNGNNVWSYSNSNLIGTTLNNTSAWNSDHDFEIGRNSASDNNYFEGSIYETRVYNKALTLNQLHRQINQEIENNGGNVRGTVIPKDIEGLLWSDLELYYKMGIIDTGYTPDSSGSNVNGHLNNMRTFQEYTAPLPYVTTASCNGSWTSSSNWEHGSVWDIHNDPPDCAIVQIKGNLQANADITTVGLLMDSGSNLDIQNDSELNVSWYLDLDGKIDLVGESQLVQGEDSTLEPTSAGTLEKDQQGTADTYTYNYWSSPVGLSNNSTNNNAYTITDVFSNVTFSSSGYNGKSSPLTIADYWVWKFNNLPSNNYASWQHVRSNGTLQVGEGFTMKGPGTGPISSEQDYTLEGKPNNGDISLTISAGNDYLIGNPYPSAIDANEFIYDHISSALNVNGRAATNLISGTLYFWEHFGGGSHNLKEYIGGYATYNLSGGVKAFANDARINNNGAAGTKIPGRYIPVAQGFFVVADNPNGSPILFKNSQRIFAKEGSASSVFLKNSKKEETRSEKTVQNPDQDLRKKIRLSFDSPKKYFRQLLITEDPLASNGFDIGYDALLFDTSNKEDMFWIIDNKNYVIQGANNLGQGETFPLGIKTDKNGMTTIKIDALENIPDETNIYLHDKELNIYHDLKAGSYKILLVPGEHLNRFEVTFTNGQSLSTNDADKTPMQVYFSNEIDCIVILNPESISIKSIEVLNLLGQSLFKFDTNTTQSYIKYKANQFVTGYYVINIETEFSKISKKVLVKK
ncbi:LamG-like jellyroll fold domain-containing protein [Seonamhaeicola sp.]|uniref:LamG-like jellyroll fold domain-containing protein n=1 Tax=Seonamhaeicola sp. TaxID=1912245 RepID=UPI002636FF6A|nr:LamG-like jellyroll fold domain-containing protein [Seonamhaeicola sp.]